MTHSEPEHLSWEEARFHVIRELERHDEELKGAAPLKDMHAYFADMRRVKERLRNLELRAAAATGGVLIIYRIFEYLLSKH